MPQTWFVESEWTAEARCFFRRFYAEEPFGWGKTIGGLARPMQRGAARLRFKFILTMAAYDLIRLAKLLGASA